MEAASKPRIGVLGIPYNVGWKGEGIDEEPKALRASGLIEHLASLQLDVTDIGDVQCRLPSKDQSNPNLLNSAQVIAVCKDIPSRVVECVRSGVFPLILGGEDSVLMGILEGLQQAFPNRRIGLIYLDAHGDFNTPETTPSGLIGGMNVAVVTGRGPMELTAIFGHQPQIPEEAIVLFGARDLDSTEKAALENSKVHVLTTKQVKDMGPDEAMSRALQMLKPYVDKVYLHMDVDVLDPYVMSALILPVPNGLTFEECSSAFKAAAQSGLICGAAVMVFNARRDPMGTEAKKVVELIGSLCGALRLRND